MVKVTIESDVRETFEAIETEMTPTLAKALLKAATFSGGAIAEVIDTTFKDPSGELAGSFLPARMVQVEGKGIGAGAVSDSKYANIQDTGEPVIKPKSGRYLSIPLSRAAKDRWPRDWPAKQLFFLEVKRTRNKFLAERVGKKLDFHYLLRESVKITGKGYIAKAIAKSEPEVLKIVDEGVQEAIDKGEM